MIKITDFYVDGWDAAIRNLRSFDRSRNKSDSKWCDKWCADCPENDGGHCESPYKNCFVVGNNDLKLMKDAIANIFFGENPSNFMKIITVTADITAPLYWWLEASKHGIEFNGHLSNMDSLKEKEFTLDDFSYERLINHNLNTDNPRIMQVAPLNILENNICALNFYRGKYAKLDNGNWWWRMIQLMPLSYNQDITVQLNYQMLRNIYHACRFNHLYEWKEFCWWIEGDLPYSELITMKEDE